ncbi:hypothetical protein D779_0298 [Imhoffiella purpurea]|uniref:Uncharacterized protein n=1 Tax=Imhoffiella purpurea TaxID=1249627 RepID=W9VAA8_9GAMM|nr:hypothetical protein D779_0298 [Imhoffiella purpurea]
MAVDGASLFRHRGSSVAESVANGAHCRRSRSSPQAGRTLKRKTRPGGRVRSRRDRGRAPVGSD